MECKNCKTRYKKNFKSRTNFPFGKKSKGVTTITCKLCGTIQ